jgi:PAS domain S-box-containing protein
VSIAARSGPRSTALADDVAVELLLEAGSVLASSLDLETTIAQIAQLTVPRLADLCVVDLLEPDGSIRKVAAAARSERLASDLAELRMRHPLDPGGAHPVAVAIRSGEPQLNAHMSSGLLEGFAQGSEHAAFMIDNAYRSALVAPLVARGRTLGALSLLRLGDCEPYAREDVGLANELARRAALAIDNASVFSNLQSVERRLEAILANLAEAITVEGPAGETVFANRAAAELLGAASVGEITSAQPGEFGSRFLIFDDQGRELSLEEMPGRRLFAGEQPGPLLVRNVVRATGEERWLMVRSSAITDPHSGRVAYAVNVFENITGVKRAQLAESFMAEASRMLASSMDYPQTLQRIARLAVPQIADWCAVDLVGEHGELERVAAYHSDPDKLAIAEELDRSYRPSLDDATGVPDVIRSGRARLYTDIQPQELASYARDAEHLRLLSAVGATAVMIVPLAAPARTIGAITLVSSESTRRLGAEDVALAERLGRRAGTAVESARLYTERTRIARVLENALLPESLPEIPGIELAGLYRAAGELNDVGGDFYDVFEYGDGRWMLVIGDVCGKGPRAAGVTALARHTLRAAAILDQPPARMLETLHAALRRQPVGADLCTVCLVTIEPAADSAQLTIALAGHPPPRVIGSAGERRQVGQPGTVLGVLDPIHINEARAELHRGETLLLFTDGLLEAGAPGQQLGEQALFETSLRGPEQSLADLLAQLVQNVSGHAHERLRDDIALLAVRLSAQTASG